MWNYKKNERNLIHDKQKCPFDSKPSVSSIDGFIWNSNQRTLHQNDALKDRRTLMIVASIISIMRTQFENVRLWQISKENRSILFKAARLSLYPIFSSFI